MMRWVAAFLVCVLVAAPAYVAALIKNTFNLARQYAGRTR